MRRALPLLLALLATSVPALRAEEPGETLAPTAPIAPLARLVAPAAGEVLPAGSLAAIEWAPAAGLAALPRAEEWEAFLSVDGGTTYPLRLTPHLDLSLRRFTFRVPPLPTRRARLLLRFGDEVREVGFEAPQSFAIVPGPATGAWAPASRAVLGRGERARPRERGVVVWTEGTRGGHGLRQVAAAGAGASLRGVLPGAALLLPLAWPAEPRPALPRPAPTGLRAPPAVLCLAALPAAPPAAAPVHLLIHRFNE